MTDAHINIFNTVINKFPHGDERAHADIIKELEDLVDSNIEYKHLLSYNCFNCVIKDKRDVVKIALAKCRDAEVYPVMSNLYIATMLGYVIEMSSRSNNESTEHLNDLACILIDSGIFQTDDASFMCLHAHDHGKPHLVRYIIKSMQSNRRSLLIKHSYLNESERFILYSYGFFDDTLSYQKFVAYRNCVHNTADAHLKIVDLANIVVEYV